MKITKQEKQSFKEVAKDKSFKSFQMYAIFFAILIIAQIILLWRHYQLLLLLIAGEASVFSAMYAGALRGLKMPASLREKIDTEIERQAEEQKNAFKLRPKVLLFVVLPLILLLIGTFIYILYSADKEREKTAYEFDTINQENVKIAIKGEQPVILGLPEEISHNEVFLNALKNYQGDRFSFSEYSKEDMDGMFFDFRIQTDIDKIFQELFVEVPTLIFFSPDKKRAIYFPGCDYCDPDSVAFLYNRKSDGFSERLAFCGTACNFLKSASFWLDNNRGMYIIDAEESPSGEDYGEMRVLQIHLIDIRENKETVYISEPVLRTNWHIVQDETAGWQTYRNEEYGFEVKYPIGWIVSQAWYGSAVKSLMFDFKSPKEDKGIYIQLQTGMFEEYWRDSYDIIIEEEIMIGGVAGLKISGILKPTNKQEIFALVKKGENLYHIHFPFFYQDEDFFNKMLSTFRFLE